MAVPRRSGAATGRIVYIALDGRLMAVSIRIASTPQTIEAGSPVPLFATSVELLSATTSNTTSLPMARGF